MASKAKKFQKQNSLVSFLTAASHGKHISNMSGIRYLVAPEFKKNCGHTLIMTFIYPYVTYCVHVWGKTHRSNLDCMITLQKRVIRILAGVHPLTHTEPIFSSLKILKFIDLVDYIIGIFTYKVYHRDVPKNIWNQLQWEPQHPWSCHQTNQLYTYCPCWYKPTQYVNAVSGRQSLESYCKA